MSEDHKTLNSNFSQSMKLRDGALQRTESKLQETELELKETRDRMQRTEQQLGIMSSELGETKETLTTMKQKLNNTEKERDELNSRINTMRQQMADLPDCCPPNWKLLSGKCLYISQVYRTWEDSKSDCEKKDSRLLVLNENSWQIKNFPIQSSRNYWIGLRYTKNYKKVWFDGSEGSNPNVDPGYPGKIVNGYLSEGKSDEQNYCICEKKPGQIKFQSFHQYECMKSIETT
ncbi:B-cell differentiation antigen CD72-like [Rhinatrema bivittatum]|uniref:B-cell differentiation antigen CD72-like n=1 Tax=Rhinatrema bivittatum TaxID=194408 RepID=UPI0011271951|nr:B-cell differentiation antigen CD72-like [Rhinatrema bivittatum]